MSENKILNSAAAPAGWKLVPEEAQAPASETALAFRYHREVHTSELREFISDAYELSAQQPEPTKCATCGQPTKFDKPFCEEHSYEPLPAPTQDEVAAALLNEAEPVYQFQWREIGEGDWMACSHSWFRLCKASPENDTRVVEVGRPAQTEQQQPWTDAMVRDFLSVALRHVEVKGTLHAQDIRDALRYMTERYAAPIAQTVPSKVDHTLDQRMIDHFTCRREDNVRGVEGFTLYFTKMGAPLEYQLYRNEAEALHYNLGRALGVAAPSQPEHSWLALPRARLERIERRLTDWLELNCCECENYHVCGRNEVTQDRDAIRSALSAHRAQQEGE